MSTTHVETAAGDFPLPPFEFTDGDAREVLVAPYEGGPGDDEFEALRSMYDGWPRDTQSQGLPPIARTRTEQWLRDVLDGVNTVAWHGETAVGHAMLVPDPDAGGEEYELAVFVRPRYQGAGVGTRLVEGLLAQGYRAGVRVVWLTVGSWNDPALRLYRRLGFETTSFLQPGWLDEGPDAHIARMELRL
ncbi:GNAT family N-acetyltransferase [Halomarina halobia]|uniref:GNAT family N-acetyltransferase n=1 Tax=Halomarina halobia TaxID=3033386 RepID=A0ABD6AEK0_9EURY|nr:GNAT family N-acetyltransferase [Halomarina sp. PSR21]